MKCIPVVFILSSSDCRVLWPCVTSNISGDDPRFASLLPHLLKLGVYFLLCCARLHPDNKQGEHPEDDWSIRRGSQHSGSDQQTVWDPQLPTPGTMDQHARRPQPRVLLCLHFFVVFPLPSFYLSPPFENMINYFMYYGIRSLSLPSVLSCGKALNCSISLSPWTR